MSNTRSSPGEMSPGQLRVEETKVALLMQGYTDITLAILAAKGAILPTFYWECTHHGLVDFVTKTGQCALCHGYGASPRSTARLNNQQYYLALCPEHGSTRHFVTNGKCATCSTSAGIARKGPTKDPFKFTRLRARHLGNASYTGFCPTHGETPFSTHRGKCLSCFTTMGARRAPRQAERTAAAELRTEARAAGRRVYFAECATHGPQRHSVSRGQCLACFTTEGQRRIK